MQDRTLCARLTEIDDLWWVTDVTLMIEWSPLPDRRDEAPARSAAVARVIRILKE